MNPQILNAIGTGISAGGSLLKAQGQLEYGESQQTAAKFAADQLRQKAGQVMAGAQLDAYGVQREADYTASKALAMAAASGGGASDPTVMNLMANNASEFAFRKMMALYSGEDQARTLNLQATAKEYEGEMANYNAKTAATGAMVQGISTILSGYSKGSSMFSAFGGGGPTS